MNEIDRIPVAKKMSFIINTEPDTEPGQHWQAIYIDSTGDQSVDFYDSYVYLNFSLVTIF